jgi:hypothetical protein
MVLRVRDARAGVGVGTDRTVSLYPPPEEAGRHVGLSLPAPARQAVKWFNEEWR